MILSCNFLQTFFNELFSLTANMNEFRGAGLIIVKNRSQKMGVP